jgi:hypothetical protein
MDGDELLDPSSDSLSESSASLESLDAWEAELGALVALEGDRSSETGFPVDVGVEELLSSSPEEVLSDVSILVLEDVRLERRIVVGVDDAPPPAPAPTMLLSLSLVDDEGELDVRLDVEVGEEVLVEGDDALVVGDDALDVLLGDGARELLSRVVNSCEDGKAPPPPLSRVERVA